MSGPGGCLLQAGVSAPGGIPACTEADTPHPGSRARHTVNERAVRILLECILVLVIILKLCSN